MKSIYAIGMALLLSAATEAREVTAPLHWVGATPQTDKAVTFGVPFDRGAVKANAVASISDDKGGRLAADFWPLAYWPDGSVKWGAVAAVIPT